MQVGLVPPRCLYKPVCMLSPCLLVALALKFDILRYETFKKISVLKYFTFTVIILIQAAFVHIQLTSLLRCRRMLVRLTLKIMNNMLISPNVCSLFGCLSCKASTFSYYFIFVRVCARACGCVCVFQILFLLHRKPIFVHFTR